ncbi:DUF5684 domain-containing protein [Microbacterium sp. H1-D42]|uniref:DUF5684 domain-containing protein n=1 Tax=Microbacterium sp. H1-D42 TaxID=2925844 RepID=UPI001F5358DE|nr:DUF5684 domain-containing protein [Microbacterium sp. H1-D42]UNK69605.1 DUF5684 domain-containing protein [Microbacterium sp. H1-D42]
MGYDDSGYAAMVAMLALVGVLLLIVGPIMYVVLSLFLMKVFEKAGVQGKWRAWVPVYSSMVLFKLGDMSPWLVLYSIGASLLLSWIPVVGWILPLAILALSAMAAWRVGLKLQKEAAWVILYVLLSPVWLGILAFDRSRWNPMIAPAPWSANGFLADRTVWDGVPVQPSQSVASQAPGYGAAPQGYAPPAPQGYQPPAQPGYGAPAQPGYGAPAQPGYGAPAQPGYGAPAQPGYGAPVPPAPGVPAPGAPVPPVPGAPVPPPATPPAPPTAPPAAPPAPPAAPPAAPEAPSADPENPNQPPA